MADGPTEENLSKNLFALSERLRAENDALRDALRDTSEALSWIIDHEDTLGSCRDARDAAEALLGKDGD